MVRAWYMDSNDGDQRLPHMTEPPEFIEIDKLNSRTGCEYFKIDLDDLSRLEQIKKERGYSYEDVCDIHKDRFPNYEEKLKNFFTEHLHSDEEIRFVTDGSGYFDVRDMEDRWIRVECLPGDMFILPAGIYHRFTLDIKDYIKCRRFFVGEPVWTPVNRPADNHPARTNYVNTMKSMD